MSYSLGKNNQAIGNTFAGLPFAAGIKIFIYKFAYV